MNRQHHAVAAAPPAALQSFFLNAAHERDQDLWGNIKDHDHSPPPPPPQTPRNKQRQSSSHLRSEFHVEGLMSSIHNMQFTLQITKTGSN